jgi:phosphatidylserine/phosphatidylglycerophosphate/cardiolipin synthase-like enzyme
VGGDQTALYSDGHLGAATRLSSITLLPSRRHPRRSSDRGGSVRCRCQGNGERAPVGQPASRLGGEHLYRGHRHVGRARVSLPEGLLHAKTISIDSEVCSIGSANIDIRSFSINYELNAVFYSEQIAKQLEADFERDLAYCTEFDPEEYRRRGTVARFRDSVARLLSPLL